MSWKDDIDESLKFGLIDMFILKLLTENDIYGYQIKKEIESRTNGVFIMKEGTLYGPLYRLESRKFISSYRVPAGLRYRNYYHIEDAGREYLDYIIKKRDEINKATEEFMNGGIINEK